MIKIWPDYTVESFLAGGLGVPLSFWEKWDGRVTAGNIAASFIKRNLEVPEEFWCKWDGISDADKIETEYKNQGMPLPESYLLIRKQCKLLIPDNTTACLVFVKTEKNNGFGEDIY